MNSTSSPQLECGNPDEKPASVSRFVLPFAYDLKICDSIEKDDLYYRQSNNFTSRRKYFTYETALVLFQKAAWLSINDMWQQTPWVKEDIYVRLNDKDIRIGMLPPNLVLFELSENKTQGNNQDKNKILQTGFLYVDIYFPDQENKPELDDLLALNEYFRYFRKPWPRHAHEYKKCLAQVPVEYKINSSNTRKVQDLNTDSSYFERWIRLLQIPIQYENKFYTLFPDYSWVDAAKRWIYLSQLSQNNLLIYADERCYCWTAAIMKKGGLLLGDQFDFSNPQTKLIAADYGHWIKLLNIDNPCATPIESHQSYTQFERDWAAERTYRRWEEWGSWYGFSYHSGAMIAPPEKDPNLCNIFRQHYFDQTVLLFYLRTTLFRFSRKLSQTITEKQSQGDINWSDNFKQLRQEFTVFSILYQSPLLSNQQQAIEMYTLAREHFDIDGLYQEIKEEIDNTYNFLEQKETSQLTKAAHTLAVWGVPLAVTAVISSLLSMEDFETFSWAQNNQHFMIFLKPVLAIIAGIISFFLAKKTSSK